MLDCDSVTHHFHDFLVSYYSCICSDEHLLAVREWGRIARNPSFYYEALP